MIRSASRFGFLLVALFANAAPAFAQITWNVTYSDGNIGPGGIGFADPTVVGSTTVGQLRRDSITAATNYLGTVFDGRGTVNLNFDASLTSGSGFLAQFGPQQYAGIAGSFQNGGVYQAARTNQRPFSGPDGSGQFNFGFGWNYAGQSPNPNFYDMTTVAIHEIGHGLGFLSLTDQFGRGLTGNSVGTPGVYAGYDRYLQRGSGPLAGAALLNTDITSTNFAAFTGPVSTLTNGNDPSTGLFFGGPLTREVLGGPAPLFAPSSYQGGSSTSHVNDPNAVMNPSVTPNTVKRFLRYEVAMFLDIGWNTYNWNSTTGNWGDGIGNLAQSRWTTDLGITYDGTNTFNTHNNPGEAPVLPVYGQVTSNIVLNFRGSGSSSYTSTNDLGSVRVARLNLNSTSTATNTITGGTLVFGVNSDGTASVVTPKIVQQNSGAFAVNSAITITDTTGAQGGGWTGLTVDGAGTGKVSLGGAITGTGTLTKAGTFTLELNGAAANTYAGVTTVNAGVLLLNKTPGTNAVGGSVTINTGGTLRLAAADQLPGTGTVTLSGGKLSTGATTGFSDTVGAFKMTASSTIELGSSTQPYALTFTGIDSPPSGSLTVTGWSGIVLSSGSAGQILFAGLSGDPNATYSSFLSSVQFTGFSSGAVFLGTSNPTTYELVPVPEPATSLGIAFGALAAVGLVARRVRSGLALE